MVFILSGEITSGSQIDLLQHIYLEVFLDYFKDKIYSEELKEIFVVMVCRPSFNGHKFRQRKKFDKDKGVFMVDVMFDYNEVMTSDLETKKKLFFNSLRQIPPLLKKMNIQKLNLESFINDLEFLIKANE